MSTSAPTYHPGEILIGDSIAMRRLRVTIAKVARSDISVLLEGPTGSGKELVAHAIHAQSGRTGHLVAFNVCAIADTVFEDALFGHVRGAYTGAVASRDGYLREADGGTLFLDEVSGLPLSSQAKLLRALETREYRPVGATQDRRSNFRTIAATNSALDELVTANAFRVDLRYRLGAFTIAVPSLAQRRDDIPVLVRHFADRAGCGAPACSFSADAIARLVAHEWRGNVRELRHVVESLMLVAEDSRVSSDDVVRLLGGASVPQLRRQDFLTRRLVAVLDEVEWKVPLAAVALGVNKATVYRWIQRLALRDTRFVDSCTRDRPAQTLGDALHDAHPVTATPPTPAPRDLHTLR
jgi:DNA-binding NtrC family response regulator